MADLAFFRGATISNDGKYRYRLWRGWEAALPRVWWVMLNPSTADALKDDATIRRCINFSKEWGFGSLEVLNLFAWRATYPADLMRAVNPVGPENDSHIKAIPEGSTVVAAWGCFSKYLGNRDRDVLCMLRGRDVQCLGMTLGGYPKHPVRLPRDTKREALNLTEEAMLARAVPF